MHEVTTRRLLPSSEITAMSKENIIVSAAFDQANDAMIITDAAERVVRINRKFTSLTGYEPQEILGQTPAMLRSGKNDPKLFTNVWSSINNSGHWRGEIWDRKKNGRLFMADLTISAVFNHHQKVSYYLGVYRDITAVKEHQLKKQQQETREPQTFLLNRQAFFEQLQTFCSEAPAHPGEAGAVVLLDLDQFHQINSEFGLAAGDTILLEVARRLRKFLRDSDILGRLDGDEFAIILPPPTNADTATKITEKLLQRLSEPYDLGNQSHANITCSLGLYPIPSYNTALDMAIAQVNAALRQAKRIGGGRWHLWEPPESP